MPKVKRRGRKREGGWSRGRQFGKALRHQFAGRCIFSVETRETLQPDSGVFFLILDTGASINDPSHISVYHRYIGKQGGRVLRTPLAGARRPRLVRHGSEAGSARRWGFFWFLFCKQA